MSSDRDIIVAMATAPGRAGVGIVRVSGAALAPVILGLLGAAGAARLQPRRALLASFLDGAGKALDIGLALHFPAPNSYTGEEVFELHGHGGPVVLRLLLARCIEAGRDVGARIAEAGEFSRRAFLNGRLDLAQAEAVADLIDAGTAAAARGALRSLQGEFSRAAQALAQTVTELRVLTEAALDFPEEGIDVLPTADLAGRLAQAATALDQVRRRARQGSLLRDGLQVALVGAPNVGKSSLLNALACEEVAIVSEYAGTTRDRIERRIEIDGVVINLVDTAGLRSTDDPVERIGVARSLAAAAEADLVLELRDDTRADESLELPGPGITLAPGTPRLLVYNKIDLSGRAAGVGAGCVYLSARTGAGLDGLRDALLRAAGWEGRGDPDAPATGPAAAAAGETVLLARERHLDALERAAAHLAAARRQANAGTGQLELLAEDLRLAADALGEITGAVSPEALLGEIFGRFCIGK